MNVLVPHDVLVARARQLLVGQPKVVRGHEAERCAGFGRICIETHALGSGGKSPWSDDEPLEGLHYEVFADYDIHAQRYIRVYASFPRVLRRSHTVDVSEALSP